MKTAQHYAEFKERSLEIWDINLNQHESRTEGHQQISQKGVFPLEDCPSSPITKSNIWSSTKLSAVQLGTGAVYRVHRRGIPQDTLELC